MVSALITTASNKCQEYNPPEYNPPPGKVRGCCHYDAGSQKADSIELGY